MASTTIRLSVETRERLRALGGATHEDTLIESLAVETIGLSDAGPG